MLTRRDLFRFARRRTSKNTVRHTGEKRCTQKRKKKQNNVPFNHVENGLPATLAEHRRDATDGRKLRGAQLVGKPVVARYTIVTRRCFDLYGRVEGPPDGKEDHRRHRRRRRRRRHHRRPPPHATSPRDETGRQRHCREGQRRREPRKTRPRRRRSGDERAARPSSPEKVRARTDETRETTRRPNGRATTTTRRRQQAGDDRTTAGYVWYAWSRRRFVDETTAATATTTLTGRRTTANDGVAMRCRQTRPWCAHRPRLTDTR